MLSVVVLNVVAPEKLLRVIGKKGFLVSAFSG
jgi:hypothetical protein